MAIPHSYRSMTLPGVFFCCTLLWAGSGLGQITDMTPESWDVLTHYSTLPAWGDYDNDGRPDLFLGEILAHNEGNGRFSAQPLPETLRNWRGLFGDYDNDGDLDLYTHSVTDYHGEKEALGRNDGGAFTDVSLEAGLTDTLSIPDAIWLDYDRDGFIDLYKSSTVASYAEMTRYTEGAVDLRNRLYRNNGDGTFADVTEAAGLGVLNPGMGNAVLGLVAADFTNDGWPDLYVGVNNGPNRLFHNDGQGGFREATTEEIAASGPSAGVAVGDIDNDGDLDIFQATNILGQMPGWRSVMLMNLGEGIFLDVTEGVGLAALSQISRFGPSLVDMDNDGDLDLGVLWPAGVYLNDGNGRFVDNSEQALAGATRGSFIPAWGDYDLDGVLDVFLAGSNPRFNTLYRMPGNDNHWLRVELVGIQSNRTGIGTRLIATSGDLRQIREILGGSSEKQDEMVAHFGLGKRIQVDHLEVRWPSGQVDVLTDIPADQRIRVFEGREGFHVVESTRWERNLPDEIVRETTRVMEAVVQPARFEPDATITRVTADLSELGGPAAVPLEADDEGSYRLNLPLEIDASHGWRTVFVNIEQHTFLGNHWVRLAKALMVLPEEDFDLFGGAEAEDWTWHGQDLMRVTDHPAEDATPSWSPDGMRLSFDTDRDGNFEIYVMDADGGNPVNLTHEPANDAMPAWSPDGAKIAFYSDRDGNFEIYIMDVDGGDPINLTHHPGYDILPAWSPDGNRIAIMTDRTGNWDLYILTLGEASRVEIDPQERGTVFTGSEALAVRAGSDWWLSCQSTAPFDWTGYASLRFAFHPGGLAASTGNELSVWIGGKEVDLLEGGWVDLAAAEWQVVEIPFAQFALEEPIAAIDFSGDFTGTFYLDDLRLVSVKPSSPGNTAVVEESAAGVPSTPTLAQNYPNPFNAGTVIAFALPEREEVELAIFNLAGQLVATLVSGTQEAGTYTIRWGGRDDDGRELASGVYLYRLRTGDGQPVETRKLVLIQ